MAHANICWTNYIFYFNIHYVFSTFYFYAFCWSLPNNPIVLNINIFHITFSYVEILPKLSFKIAACGGNLRGLNGVLKYPSTASKRYDQGVSCEWTIETTNSSLVLNVTFKKFSTEGSSDCKYDWLEVNIKSSIKFEIIKCCFLDIRWTWSY